MASTYSVPLLVFSIIYVIAFLWLIYTVIKNLTTGKVTGPRPMFYREKGQKTLVTINKTDEPMRYWTAIFMRTFLLAALLYMGVVVYF